MRSAIPSRLRGRTGIDLRLGFISGNDERTLPTTPSAEKQKIEPRLRSSGLPELEYEKVCRISTEEIYPQKAKNKNGEFRFIVNGGSGLEEYVQAVRISKCEGAGMSCDLESPHQTECRQEFMEHKLVALDEAGKQLEIDSFPLPSGCSCYKLNHEL